MCAILDGLKKVRLYGKFAVDNNRLKQYILCLLPPAVPRLKSEYVPQCGMFDFCAPDGDLYLTLCAP